MFKETTGHVSARLDKEHMLIRGRGPKETGLLFTKPSDVIVADLDGRNRDKKAGLKPPNEAVIHGEIYKARENTAGRPPALGGALQHGGNRAQTDLRRLRSEQHAAGLETHSGLPTHADAEHG